MGQLTDALFTSTQQALLGLFYGRPAESFYFKQVLRHTGMGVATIKRQLDSFSQAGLLTMEKVGNQHHYQANPQCPIYEELRAIVRKTLGVAAVLAEALCPLEEKIARAFVFGSVASGKETKSSDIDLLIVGDVLFPEVVTALYPVQDTLGKEINPKIYSQAQWKALQEKGDAFVRDVMAKPQLDVIGGKDESG